MNSKIEENVFMEQPKIFEESDSKNFICKLNTILHQSGRDWNNYINDKLIKLDVTTAFITIIRKI